MIKDVINKYNLEFKLDKKLSEKLNELNLGKENKYKIKKYKDKEFPFINLYRSGKRKIIIHSYEKINISYIKKIDKILNFFDEVFGREKVFLIKIYLNNNPKLITKDLPYPCRKNINSATNLTGTRWLVIFRKEEWSKILVHELIHYFNLHIYSIKKDLLYAFKNINTNSIINPNEGYTEFSALIFYYFIFNKENIDEKLTKELEWGFIQSAKILKYKGYNSYQELFSGKEYTQDTSLLSYYILKTYFLFKRSYQKCIKLEVVEDRDCFKNINLEENRFSSIMNYYIKNLDLDDKSLKMSLT